MSGDKVKQLETVAGGEMRRKSNELLKAAEPARPDKELDRTGIQEPKANFRKIDRTEAKEL